MFLFGPPNVEKLVEKRNVRGLAKAARYKKDSATRIAAIRAIRGIPVSPSDIERPLLEALKDDEEDVVVEAIVTLGSKKFKMAVSPLVEILASPSERIRDAATNALVETGEKAVETLIWYLQRCPQEYPEPRTHAAAALAGIGKPARKPLQEALESSDDPYWAAEEPLSGLLADGLDTITFENCKAPAAALVRIGSGAVGPMLNAISRHAGSLSIDSNVGQVLRSIGCIEPLTAKLEEEYDGKKVFGVCIKALGFIGDPRAAPALLAFAKQLTNDTARKWTGSEVSQALASLGPGAIPVLVEALKDENPRTREVAATALSRVGMGKISELRARVRSAEGAGRTSHNAAYFSSLTGDMAALEKAQEEAPIALAALKDDPDEHVRSAASMALRGLEQKS